MGEMTLLLDEEQEIEEMGSYNHSTVQANLAFLFKRLGKYIQVWIFKCPSLRYLNKVFRLGSPKPPWQSAG